jgi:hypothetical protein
METQRDRYAYSTTTTIGKEQNEAERGRNEAERGNTNNPCIM